MWAAFSGKLLRLYCQNVPMNTSWFSLVYVFCLLADGARTSVGLEDSAHPTWLFAAMRSGPTARWWTAAPTGRPSIARGVNPWNTGQPLETSPNGAAVAASALSVAPLGLAEAYLSGHQGFTPLVTDGRPVGAAGSNAPPFLESGFITCGMAPICRVGRVFEAHQPREPLSRFSYAEPHMGTQFRIVLYARDQTSATAAATAAFKRV